MSRFAILLIVAISSVASISPAARLADETPAAHPAFAQWKNGPSADPAYFPIAVWLQSPEQAAKYKAAGINLYIGLWDGPTEQQLAELAKAGMPVICEMNEFARKHKDDPRFAGTIVGWMHGDEPDNAQEIKDPKTGKTEYGPPRRPESIVADYNAMVAADPTRPIMLNLGQGVTNDEWIGRGSAGKPSDYLTYVKGGDIISFDIYPVAGLDKPNSENDLWLVPQGVDRLLKWSSNKKLVWNCIECTHIANPERIATGPQVKAEVWMSLIHGSTGLIYFVHQFKPTFNEHALLNDPAMLQAVTAINLQIRDLAPVLNSPTIPGGATVISSNKDVPIDLMLKRHGGSTYAFAVAMRNGSTHGTFAVKDLPEKTIVEVIGESRTIPIRAGEFADDFRPYDVHLYRIQN